MQVLFSDTVAQMMFKNPGASWLATILLLRSLTDLFFFFLEAR